MVADVIDREDVTEQFIEDALRLVNEGDGLTEAARRALAEWRNDPLFDLAVVGLVDKLHLRMMDERRTETAERDRMPQQRSHVALRLGDVFEQRWGNGKRLRDFTPDDCTRYEKQANGNVHTWDVRQKAFVKARAAMQRHSAPTIGELPESQLEALRAIFMKAWS